MARSARLLVRHHARFGADVDEDGDATGGDTRAEALVLIAVVGLGAHFDEAWLLEGEAEVPDFKPELDYELGEEGEGGQWAASLAGWVGDAGRDLRDGRGFFYFYVHCGKVVR
jgi:hypothetical protein